MGRYNHANVMAHIVRAIRILRSVDDFREICRDCEYNIDKKVLLDDVLITIYTLSGANVVQLGISSCNIYLFEYTISHHCKNFKASNLFEYCQIRSGLQFIIDTHPNLISDEFHTLIRKFTARIGTDACDSVLPRMSDIHIWWRSTKPMVDSRTTGP